MIVDGPKLRQWRHRAGLSLSGAAAQLRISRQHLSHVELGHKGVSPAVAAKARASYGSGTTFAAAFGTVRTMTNEEAAAYVKELRDRFDWDPADREGGFPPDAGGGAIYKDWDSDW